jgi:hypothetical protein
MCRGSATCLQDWRVVGCDGGEGRFVARQEDIDMDVSLPWVMADF